VILGLGELLMAVLAVGLLVLGVWVVWGLVRGGSSSAVLPGRQRAELAMAIGQARWAPGHDETDGVTRVLVRKSYTGLDGRPAVLEERVLETFSATDPAWEALFTEAMSKARFRCQYLNAEESS
jgi:hypothetical protein